MITNRIGRQSERRAQSARAVRFGLLLTFVTLFLSAMIPLNVEAGDAAAGAKLFKQNCARCHGQAAKGDGPDLVKLQSATSPDDWTDKSVNQSLTDTFIISMITKGGKANGKSPIMPAFAGKLNADQMQDLLAFLRSVAH
jgi:mono/diheme cytochrome c family protein